VNLQNFSRDERMRLPECPRACPRPSGGPGGALPQPPGSAPAIGIIGARHFSSARRSLARPHAEAAIKAAKMLEPRNAGLYSSGRS
jgi:hypothetical protein